MSTASSVMDMKPVMSSVSQMKPTFPAAAAVTTVVSNVSNATITGAPMIKKPESSSGLTSRLMHPDEDISLVSQLLVSIILVLFMQVSDKEYSAELLDDFELLLNS